MKTSTQVYAAFSFEDELALSSLEATKPKIQELQIGSLDQMH